MMTLASLLSFSIISEMSYKILLLESAYCTNHIWVYPNTVGYIRTLHFTLLMRPYMLSEGKLVQKERL